MRACWDIIAAATFPRGATDLVRLDHVTWARSAELIIGAVSASGDGWRECIERAHDALDSCPVPLTREDFWSLVLLVEMPNDTPDAILRLIEHQTTGSRKLAFREGDAIPQLFGSLTNLPGSSAPARASATTAVTGALDEFAQGDTAMRNALEVLLKARQPKDDVDLLVRLLAGDNANG